MQWYRMHTIRNAIACCYGFNCIIPLAPRPTSRPAKPPTANESSFASKPSIIHRTGENTSDCDEHSLGLGRDSQLQERRGAVGNNKGAGSYK